MHTDDGHAPEPVMLYCAEEKLFLSTDQVLAKISPNVSIWAVANARAGSCYPTYIRSTGLGWPRWASPT